MVNEFADATANDTYTVDVDTSSFAYGTHTFKVISTAVDYTTHIASSQFVLGKSYFAPLHSGVSTAVQTFDAMDSKYDIQSSDVSIIEDFSQNFGWTFDPGSSELNIARMTGASNAAGDYAVRIGRVKSGTGGGITFNGWPGAFTAGTAVVEFDVAVLPANLADIRTKGMSRTAYNNLIFNGTVHDTDVSVADNEWHHFKLSCDADTKKVSFWVDGDLKTSNADGSFNALDEFGFSVIYWANADYYIRNNWAWMGLDNFKTYSIQKLAPQKSEYVFGTNTIDAKDGIMAGAESLKIDFGAGFDAISASDITISVNGAEGMNPTFAATDDGVVTVALPELSAGDNIKVTFASTLLAGGEAIGKELSAEYDVLAPESDIIYSVNGMKEENSVFSCNINVRNLTSSTESYSIIIASYDGDELVDVAVFEDETASKGIYSVPKTLTLSDNADAVGVFVWGDMDTIKPVIPKTPYER